MNKHQPAVLCCCVLLLVAILGGCTMPRVLWSQADSGYTAVKIKDWENPNPGQRGNNPRIACPRHE